MSASITPVGPVPLFGREVARMSTKVASALEANLIPLPSANGLLCIVGLDTLFASKAFSTAVGDRLKAADRQRIDDVIFVASHTHNAPALDPTKPGLGAVERKYFTFAADAVADLVSRAVAAASDGARRIGSLARGNDACHLNAVRRRKGLRIEKLYPYVTVATNMAPKQSGSVPRNFEIAVAYDPEGTPLWAIWSWCCHPTSSPDVTAVCADFPGFVRQHLRNRLQAPMLPVVFLPGFCGDVRPDASLLPIDAKSLLARPLQRSFAQATKASYVKLCRALAVAADNALDRLRPQALAKVVRQGQTQLRLSSLISGCSRRKASETLEIRAISLGDFGLLLAGAEVCSPYIKPLKEAVPPDWFLSGYCNQIFGYLPSDAQVSEGGYEGGEFFASFGLEGRFQARIEEKFVSAARRATARCLAHEKQKTEPAGRPARPN